MTPRRPTADDILLRHQQDSPQPSSDSPRLHITSFAAGHALRHAPSRGVRQLPLALQALGSPPSPLVTKEWLTQLGTSPVNQLIHTHLAQTSGTFPFRQAGSYQASRQGSGSAQNRQPVPLSRHISRQGSNGSTASHTQHCESSSRAPSLGSSSFSHQIGFLSRQGSSGSPVNQPGAVSRSQSVQLPPAKAEQLQTLSRQSSAASRQASAASSQASAASSSTDIAGVCYSQSLVASSLLHTQSQTSPPAAPQHSIVLTRQGSAAFTPSRPSFVLEQLPLNPLSTCQHLTTRQAPQGSLPHSLADLQLSGTPVRGLASNRAPAGLSTCVDSTLTASNVSARPRSHADNAEGSRPRQNDSDGSKAECRLQTYAASAELTTPNVNVCIGSEASGLQSYADIVAEMGVQKHAPPFADDIVHAQYCIPSGAMTHMPNSLSYIADISSRNNHERLTGAEICSPLASVLAP